MCYVYVMCIIISCYIINVGLCADADNKFSGHLYDRNQAAVTAVRLCDEVYYDHTIAYRCSAWNEIAFNFGVL